MIYFRYIMTFFMAMALATCGHNQEDHRPDEPKPVAVLKSEGLSDKDAGQGLVLTISDEEVLVDHIGNDWGIWPGNADASHPGARTEVNGKVVEWEFQDIIANIYYERDDKEIVIWSETVGDVLELQFPQRAALPENAYSAVGYRVGARYYDETGCKSWSVIKSVKTWPK